MAGATFAVTAEPPIIWLCVLLAIPGIVGWILPYFIYQYFVKKQSHTIQYGFIVGQSLGRHMYQACTVL